MIVLITEDYSQQKYRQNLVVEGCYIPFDYALFL